MRKFILGNFPRFAFFPMLALIKEQRLESLTVLWIIVATVGEISRYWGEKWNLHFAITAPSVDTAECIGFTASWPSSPRPPWLWSPSKHVQSPTQHDLKLHIISRLVLHTSVSSGSNFGWIRNVGSHANQKPNNALSVHTPSCCWNAIIVQHGCEKNKFVIFFFFTLPIYSLPCQQTPVKASLTSSADSRRSFDWCLQFIPLTHFFFLLVLWWLQLLWLHFIDTVALKPAGFASHIR